MDQKQLQQKIAELYSKLPKEVQEMFSSMTWMEDLQIISKRHNLSVDKIEILGAETTLLILGSISLQEYINNLYRDLKVPDELAEQIINEVSDVLAPILPILVKAYGDNARSLMIEKYGDIKQLDERFQKLPEEVQIAISESNYQLKILEIVEDKQLSIEQAGIFEEVTNKVLLNVIHPDKYEEELNNKLGLKPDVISEIVGRVNEEILKNIRDILRTHWEKSKGMAQEGEDEVPLPPYALIKPETPKTFTTVIQKPAEITPKTESSIYKSAGIEMMKDEPEKEDVMKSIIGSKLNAPTVSKPVVSNQTMPKITPVAPTTPKPLNITQPQMASPSEKPHDPYHEAV